MTVTSDGVLFDASNYPGFDKARARKKRNRPLGNLDFLEGAAYVALLCAALGWMVYEGAFSEQPLVVAVIISAVAFICLVMYIMARVWSSEGTLPVIVHSNGDVRIGKRCLPAEDIVRLDVWGHFGDVEFISRSGKVLASVERPQLGSLEDFIIVFRRFNPGVVVKGVSFPAHVRHTTEEAF